MSSVLKKADQLNLSLSGENVVWNFWSNQARILHMPQQLSSCGMWKILAWLDHPIYEESLFLQDLDFEILNNLWNRSLVSSHAAHFLKKKSFLYCCWKTYILPDESLQMSSESPLVISFIEAQQCHVAF